MEIQKQHNASNSLISTGSTSTTMTISYVISNDSLPAINTLKKMHGVEYITRALSILLDQVQLFFNVSVPMSPAQISITCDLILERFGNYKIQDFQICFRKAMAGDYGKLYNRIDGAIILEWLNTYDNERTEEIVKLRERENVETKMTAAQIFQTPAMQKVLQQVTDKMKHVEIKNEDAPRKLSPLEQRIFDDWSALPKLPNLNISMANVENTVMDFTQYRNFRINEYLNAE